MAVADIAQSRIPHICESIDRLISTEIEAKPGASRGMILKLYEAARAKTDKPLVQGAAEALLEAVKGGGPVIVSSGWVIDFWYSKGELCGMIGATALTRAISQGLRTQACFVTEEQALSVFNAAARAVGMKVFPYERLSELPNVVAARSFPVDPQEAETEAKRMLDQLKPSAIITVEKCGPNKVGVHHTGRGTDMSATTAKVDVLVRQARERGVLTIGIGDLGNEIGFGNILSAVQQYLPKGADCGCPCGGGIAAATETDHLIVAASSNRGGYGLAAALGTLVGDVSLMPTGAEDTRMIQAAAFEGACDSFTTSPTATDGHGMPAEYSAHFIELLRYQIMARDIDYPMFSARA